MFNSIRSILAGGALLLASVLSAAEPNTLTPEEKAAGWQLLFDGKTLDGWKASEHPETFKVQDGCIVTDGKRAHLFYDGPVENHDFTNFEIRADVMTFPKANSGLYIHTTYQEKGWPDKGYEIQINNSADDLNSRTASVFNVRDTKDVVVGDNTWFVLRIRVQGKRITTWIDDKMIIDYTEEEHPKRHGTRAGWLLSHGTFALQAHNIGSRALFRTIAVRPL